MLKQFKVVIIVTGILTIFALALPALAQNYKEAYLPVGETATGNFYAYGRTVEIAGNVESDLYVAGGNVIVTGEVGGDVIAVGGNVRIAGPVGGNVRVLGGTVEIASSIGRNLLAGADKLRLLPSSQILGHLTAGANEIILSGTIEGSVKAGAGNVSLEGAIKGPLDLWLEKEGKLSILSSANIAGVLVYHSSQEAYIAKGAKLASAPKFEKWQINKSHKYDSAWGWGQLVGLFGLLVLGMVMVSVAPKKVEESAQQALSSFWSNLGWGALWLFVVPIVCLLLLITIIGIPLAVILLALYVISFFISQVVIGAAIAWFLKSNKNFSFLKNWSPLVLVIVGIVAYRFIANLPVVGILVVLMGTLWAMGAIVKVHHKTLTSFR